MDRCDIPDCPREEWFTYNGVRFCRSHGRAFLVRLKGVPGSRFAKVEAALFAEFGVEQPQNVGAP